MSGMSHVEPPEITFDTTALLESLPNACQVFDQQWRYVYLNAEAERRLGRSREQLAGKVFWEVYPERVGTPFHASCLEAIKTGKTIVFEDFLPQEGKWVEFSLHPYPGGLCVFQRDITERKRADGVVRQSEEHTAALLADLAEERDTLDTVNRIGRLLSAELDLDRLVQAATDAATELTGAQFGAFFYNVVKPGAEAYVLYTISGAPRKAFSVFPMPHNTPVFGPTFRGEGVIRSADITKDPRYGQMGPHHGMPAGHLPVRSYLAVPVISRSGEVVGGLFFGHPEPGVFTERAERNVEALVGQLAVAMDNARLYRQTLQASEQARCEIEERKRAEEELHRAAEALRHSVEVQARHARLSALRADVSAALAEGGTLPEMLQQCVEPLVEHLDAAFARIWTLDEQENVLVLQASAGMYTHRDGPHSRVPVGQKKIGLIAQEMKPHLTNDVLTDERISEKAWAQREGMVSFAGYPLLLEDRVVGVVALFARHILEADTLDTLASIADALAQGVERKRVEQRLAKSEARQRVLVKDVLASVTEGKLRLCNSAADLPERLPALGEPLPLSRKALRDLRHRVMKAAQATGLDKDRANDLITASSEAGMNAVVHAGGGKATVGMDVEAGMVQVWVEDEGRGIAMSSIPRATLDRGYTTAGTLGHGFKMVLGTVDAVWLLTGPSGTTVVLSQGREAAQPGWLGKI